MTMFDYTVVGLFAVLLLFKSTRYAAACILAGYAVYFTFIVPTPSDENYYRFTAVLNLAIGWVLFTRYKIVAALSFSLIVVSSLGLVIYHLGGEPTAFNNLSYGIITLQLLMLYLRMLKDAKRFARTNNGWRYPVVRPTDNNRLHETIRLATTKQQER